MKSPEKLLATNDNTNRSNAIAGELSHREEDMESQSLTESEERSLGRLAKIFEQGGDLAKHLGNKGKVDMLLADGARKLQNRPELEFNSLSYNSLTAEQQKFIGEAIIISDGYTKQMEEKTGLEIAA